MHPNSINLMKEFLEKYLNHYDKLKILDVGSRDDLRAYRNLCDNSEWEYLGVDLRGGYGVDMILERPYDYPFTDGEFDVVISGQTLEHVEDTHRWIIELNRILKVGGYICIIAPWQAHLHPEPKDCWRILPDGMKFLLGEIGKFEVLETFIRANDTIGIGKKRR